MKRRFSITIDETVFNTMLKDKRNISQYIEDMLRAEYAETNQSKVIRLLADKLTNDQDFIIKTILAKKRIPDSAFCPCKLPSCERLHYHDL